MMSMNFRRTLVCTAVATTLGLLAEPATAAPYQGIFDPDDLSGQYIINVSPTCLLTSGWHANAGICAATLLSAYADVVSSSPNPTYTGRLTFAPPAISSSLQLFGLYVYGGQIDSFDTAPLPQVGEAPGTPDNWFLKFTSGQMPCTYPCINIDGGPADTTVKGPSLRQQPGRYRLGAIYGGPGHRRHSRARYAQPVARRHRCGWRRDVPKGKSRPEPVFLGPHVPARKSQGGRFDFSPWCAPGRRRAQGYGCAVAGSAHDGPPSRAPSPFRSRPRRTRGHPGRATAATPVSPPFTLGERRNTSRSRAAAAAP